MNKDDFFSLIAHPLFLSLSPENKALLEKLPVQSIDKGRALCMQDTPAAQCFFVVSGWVKLYRDTLNGDEYIVDILNAGHSFAERALFLGQYPYSAETVADSTIIFIPLALLQRFLDTEPAFAQSLLRFFAHRQKQQEKALEHQTVQNAPQRIGCFLLRLCPERLERDITVHLPYDKTLLATRLGMKRETLSRALAQLMQETGIIVQGATVTIPNKKALITYSCAACSDSYPCGDT